MKILNMFLMTFIAKSLSTLRDVGTTSCPVVYMIDVMDVWKVELMMKITY